MTPQECMMSGIHNSQINAEGYLISIGNKQLGDKY
jgi:hypothetical protein